MVRKVSRQRVVEVGDASMALVVEKVKGRLYVCDEYRENGRVVTKCIGPVEEMVCLVGIQEPRQGREADSVRPLPYGSGVSGGALQRDGKGVSRSGG